MLKPVSRAAEAPPRHRDAYLVGGDGPKELADGVSFAVSRGCGGRGGSEYGGGRENGRFRDGYEDGKDGQGAQQCSKYQRRLRGLGIEWSVR